MPLVETEHTAAAGAGSTGQTSAISDLPDDLADDAVARRETEQGPLPPDATLRDITEATMLSVLSAADGNVSRAARQLGVDRSTFYRRLIRPAKLQG